MIISQINKEICFSENSDKNTSCNILNENKKHTNQSKYIINQ